MKYLTAILFTLCLAVPAQATTSQTVKQDRLKYGLQHLGSASQLKLVVDGLANVLYYDTYAELAAASPTAGTFGWAIDTKAMYLYNGTTWAGLSSTTSFTGAQGGTLDNATNNVWKFTESTEDLTLTFSADNVAFASTTGATFTFTPATAFTGASTHTGAVYANGGVDRSSAAALAIGATNATSVVITPATTVTGALYGNGGLDRSTAAALAIGASNANAVNITPATTVTGLLTGTGGVKTTKPLFLFDRVRFCGNGSNGTTPWYDGPVLPADYGSDMSIGSAGCDANDSDTEATADRPIDPYTPIKVVGMMCVTQAGGSADTNTFQLRSATADVAGVACSVTNDGAAAKQCTVILATPVTVAGGATLAVKNTQSGTDNMSAKDMGCTAYYTY